MHSLHDNYYKMLSNDFTFISPRLKFNADASLMVGVSGHIKLYHAAGPKIVIGPRALLTDTVKIDPLEIDASAKISLTTILAFDVTIAKYKMGNWSQTINLLPPREIWSYHFRDDEDL